MGLWTERAFRAVRTPIALIRVKVSQLRVAQLGAKVNASFAHATKVFALILKSQTSIVYSGGFNRTKLI
ncbi:hypothetical protein BTE48_01775 [Oceanospirillum multiglobuliferum]|uniref:Uncharacterized protein n=1 Tax=Oceanospirillum multiglobuliferum TaxID=64969 RepID=A0A1V4T9G7_9GAMM|nr:hypothetical protein BTE48_01775 [Oceanospirillum multiglobuliferum]